MAFSEPPDFSPRVIKESMASGEGAGIAAMKAVIGGLPKGKKRSGRGATGNSCHTLRRKGTRASRRCWPAVILTAVNPLRAGRQQPGTAGTAMFHYMKRRSHPNSFVRESQLKLGDNLLRFFQEIRKSARLPFPHYGLPVPSSRAGYETFCLIPFPTWVPGGGIF